MAGSEKNGATDRRGFLKVFGLGTAAAGVAVLGTGEEVEASDAAPGNERAGYRETAHVRTFYDSARF